MRRKFSLPVMRAITLRATDASSGRVHCEGCGVWCKSRAEYEIDHLIAEGRVPGFRKARKLTAADGRLLCKAQCHPLKTKIDDGLIAQAKRLEAAQPLHGAGEPEIARRFKARDPDLDVAEAAAKAMIEAAEAFFDARKIEGDRRNMLLSCALSGAVLLPGRASPKVTLNTITSLMQIAIREGWIGFSEAILQ
jgi:hypothetical protein